MDTQFASIFFISQIECNKHWALNSSVVDSQSSPKIFFEEFFFEQYLRLNLCTLASAMSQNYTLNPENSELSRNKFYIFYIGFRNFTQV